MSYTAAVLTISDNGARGERKDTSGSAIMGMLRDRGYEVEYYRIIPDETEQIQQELIKCADELKISLILTTGGTGFSPRDVTPEATLAVIEREAGGIPAAMWGESLKITARACLSRCVAGIRGRSLIINLPGSEKAARENLQAVIEVLPHGLDMLISEGSADCAAAVEEKKAISSTESNGEEKKAISSTESGEEEKKDISPLEFHKGEKKPIPSMDLWLKEAKAAPGAHRIGMYLTHNGIVRETPKAKVRNGEDSGRLVSGMLFSYDKEKVDRAIEETKALEGIYYVRLWLNEGKLKVGDDIMYILIGGDIRPRVVEALSFLLGKIKTECVKEEELYHSEG